MEESAPTTESSPSILTDGPAQTGAPDTSHSILDGSIAVQESNPLAFDPGLLPDDLRGEPSLQSFDSVDKLAKSYVHARKMIGVDPEEVVRMPKDGDADSWNQVYNRLGRPETSDEYDFDLGDGELTEDVADFKKVAHELGLSNTQARSILGIYNQLAENDISEEDSQFEQMNVDYLTHITKEWGDDFNKNSELARRAFMNFASEDAIQVLKETGLSNHPEILKTFARIGQAMSEDNILPGTRGSIGGMSMENAEQSISEKMADKDFREAYLDQYHPNHDSAVRDMTRLFGYSS